MYFLREWVNIWQASLWQSLTNITEDTHRQQNITWGYLLILGRVWLIHSYITYRLMPISAQNPMRSYLNCSWGRAQSSDSLTLPYRAMHLVHSDRIAWMCQCRWPFTSRYLIFYLIQEMSQCGSGYCLMSQRRCIWRVKLNWVGQNLPTNTRESRGWTGFSFSTNSYIFQSGQSSNLNELATCYELSLVQLLLSLRQLRQDCYWVASLKQQYYNISLCMSIRCCTLVIFSVQLNLFSNLSLFSAIINSFSLSSRVTLAPYTFFICQSKGSYGLSLLFFSYLLGFLQRRTSGRFLTLDRNSRKYSSQWFSLHMEMIFSVGNSLSEHQRWQQSTACLLMQQGMERESSATSLGSQYFTKKQSRQDWQSFVGERMWSFMLLSGSLGTDIPRMRTCLNCSASLSAPPIFFVQSALSMVLISSRNVRKSLRTLMPARRLMRSTELSLEFHSLRSNLEKQVSAPVTMMFSFYSRVLPQAQRAKSYIRERNLDLRWVGNVPQEWYSTVSGLQLSPPRMLRLSLAMSYLASFLELRQAPSLSVQIWAQKEMKVGWSRWGSRQLRAVRMLLKRSNQLTMVKKMSMGRRKDTFWMVVGENMQTCWGLQKTCRMSQLSCYVEDQSGMVILPRLCLMAPRYCYFLANMLKKPRMGLPQLSRPASLSFQIYLVAPVSISVMASFLLVISG